MFRVLGIYNFARRPEEGRLKRKMRECCYKLLFFLGLYHHTPTQSYLCEEEREENLSGPPSTKINGSLFENLHDSFFFRPALNLTQVIFLVSALEKKTFVCFLQSCSSTEVQLNY